jgi:hypothetical protein
VKTFSDFAANETHGCRQSFHGAFSFIFIAFHSYENSRGTRIIRKSNATHSRQTDSGVPKFALQDRKDLLAQSFSQTSAMIYCASVLHFSPQNKTDENIRKTRELGWGWKMQKFSFSTDRYVPR